MGLFDEYANRFKKFFDTNHVKKILDTKYCAICNEQINLLGMKMLSDGICCKACASKLSPFFTERRKSSVQEIAEQLKCREANRNMVSEFHATRVLGTKMKVYIDEDHDRFIVTASKNYTQENPDVIDCSLITSCIIDIQEEIEEIKFKDSHGNIKSFTPKSYAHSYNFYIELNVNIPYINTIRFKLNDQPIDNDQETLIEIKGGLGTMIADTFGVTRSNNGISSNAEQVKASIQYQKYNQCAQDIYQTLMQHRLSARHHYEKRKHMVICPWCGTSVEYGSQGICDRCCGVLDA